MATGDLERMVEQERRLRFRRFDLATAWDLGCRLRAAAAARGVAVAIEVRLAHETVFFSAMPGTTPLNADWARRKRNTVELTQRSSYAIGQAPLSDGRTMHEHLGLPMRDYAVAGGGFPIFVEGVGCVGAAMVSGLPQREDHALLVEVLAEMCDVPLAEVELGEMLPRLKPTRSPEESL